MSRLQVIYRARELHQAFMLQSLLDDHGIRAQVIRRDALSSGEHPNRFSEVVVAQSDVEIAGGIARLFDQHVVRTWGAVRDSGMDEGEQVGWHAWPTCPHCRVRRQTICPVCKTAGHHFARGHLPRDVPADAIAADLTSAAFLAADETLSRATPTSNVDIVLLCSGCDEAFVPRFYALCEHCGHVFPDGIETQLMAESEGSSSGPFCFGIALLAAFLLGLYLLST